MFSNLLKTFAVLGTKSKTKLALVVRSDIKMGKGKTAAQCAHAAILCYQNALQSSYTEQRELLEAWTLTGQPKIVLRAENYDEILRIMKLAQKSNIVAEIVRDAGRTQLEEGTATVLGLGPARIEDIDNLVRHLKLL